jgi:hypothetical protein
MLSGPGRQISKFCSARSSSMAETLAETQANLKLGQGSPTPQIGLNSHRADSGSGSGLKAAALPVRLRSLPASLRGNLRLLKVRVESESRTSESRTSESSQARTQALGVRTAGHGPAAVPSRPVRAGAGGNLNLRVTEVPLATVTAARPLPVELQS